MNMLINTDIKPGIRAKQMICLALVITFLLLCIPIPTQAASKNAIAREAYLKALTSGKCTEGGGIPHAFFDINGDGIDELITYPGFGAVSYEIFTYLNGKIKRLVGAGDSGIRIFPSTHVVAFTGAGRQGCYNDTYHKISGGKVTEVAAMYWGFVDEMMDEDFDFDTAETWEEYYVKGKETTKTDYNKYIKTLTKGTSFGHNDLQWEYNLVTNNNNYNDFYDFGAKSTTTSYVVYRALRTGNVYFALSIHDTYSTRAQVTLMDKNKKKINTSFWQFTCNKYIPNPFAFSTSYGWATVSFTCTLQKNKFYYLKIVTTNKKSTYGGYTSRFVLNNYSYRPY